MRKKVILVLFCLEKAILDTWKSKKFLDFRFGISNFQYSVETIVLAQTSENDEQIVLANFHEKRGLANQKISHLWTAIVARTTRL